MLERDREIRYIWNPLMKPGFVFARSLLSVLLFAQVAAGQVADSTRRSPSGSVRGVVNDSIGGGQLVAAIVQLADARNAAAFSTTTVTDSLGRFLFDRVPSGLYTLGFFHPLLDSLGVAAPLREVSIDDGQSVRADLAVPSARRLRAAICGGRSRPDSGAVILGVVRQAHDRLPAESVTVTAQWLEITLGPNGFVRRVAQIGVVTAADGWFALCDAPKGGAAVLRASRGADSTDLLEVRVPTAGLLRRELYIGSAVTAFSDDSAALLRRHMRGGDGRLGGTVVRAVSGEPIAGARVSIPDGPQTRSNEAGEWILMNVPSGTRMLEIRAVGYYPERRVVDVLADAPPIRAALSTFLAVLDTVRVTAARLIDPRYTGFQDRRRSAMGRYLTAVDIARRQPRTVSELLRRIPDIRLDRFGTYIDTTAVDTSGTGSNPIGSTTDTRILMRALYKDWCFPTFFIDGHQVNTLTAEEIDAWLRPEELAGIEVYTDANVPPQFHLALSGCGSILIWRK
jgi:hypothetical protein